MTGGWRRGRRRPSGAPGQGPHTQGQELAQRKQGQGRYIGIQGLENCIGELLREPGNCIEGQGQEHCTEEPEPEHYIEGQGQEHCTEEQEPGHYIEEQEQEHYIWEQEQGHCIWEQEQGNCTLAMELYIEERRRRLLCTLELEPEHYTLEPEICILERASYTFVPCTEVLRPEPCTEPVLCRARPGPGTRSYLEQKQVSRQ